MEDWRNRCNSNFNNTINFNDQFISPHHKILLLTVKYYYCKKTQFVTEPKLNLVLITNPTY